MYQKKKYYLEEIMKYPPIISTINTKFLNAFFPTSYFQIIPHFKNGFCFAAVQTAAIYSFHLKSSSNTFIKQAWYKFHQVIPGNHFIQICVRRKCVRASRRAITTFQALKYLPNTQCDLLKCNFLGPIQHWLMRCIGVCG